MKRVSILCFLFCIAVVLNAIEPKDYQAMTTHDRISLAVSYYEVFIKWKDEKGKKAVEAKSYLKEAYKIEPDVEKYNGFSDMPSDEVSKKAVSWAVNNGITDKNRTFDGESALTRRQAMVILKRFYKTIK